MGLLIDESAPVAARRGLLVSIDVKPREYATVKLKRMVDTMTHAHDKMVMDEFAELVVRLPAAAMAPPSSK